VADLGFSVTGHSYKYGTVECLKCSTDVNVLKVWNKAGFNLAQSS